MENLRRIDEIAAFRKGRNGSITLELEREMEGALAQGGRANVGAPAGGLANCRRPGSAASLRRIGDRYPFSQTPAGA
jgi:hypothetical protein